MVLQAAGGALAQVGVQAVVENLGNFGKAFSSMNNMMDGFGNKASLLSRAFEPVNKVLGAFFESMRRIAEFVISGLLLRGIDAIGNAIRGWVSALIDAAIEFQNIQVRIEGLLAQDILKTGGAGSLQEALVLSKKEAEELFYWMQKLAVTTPVNTTDIANVFTLAKSYGFATAGAKDLTVAIIDYVSYMGLSDVQMTRVIENFGQMMQQGKITGTELRDLARGALLPVNELLALMQENLGMSGISLEDFRKQVSSGEIEVSSFIDAFMQLASTRWAGAGERANRTIKGLISSVKELAIEVIGLNVVKPVLDTFGLVFSQILSAITSGGRFEYLIGMMKQLGRAFSDLLYGFLEINIGSPEGAADKILEVFDKIKGKILGIISIVNEMMQGNATSGQGVSAILQVLGINEDISGKLGTFVDNLGRVKFYIGEIIENFTERGWQAGLGAAGVPQQIITFIETLISAFGNIQTFWDENGEDIKLVLSDVIKAITEAVMGGKEVDTNKTSLLEVVGALIETLFGLLVEKGPDIVSNIETIGDTITEDFIPAFYEVSDWIVDNQDLVFRFIAAFILGLAALETTARICSIAMFGIGAALVVGLGSAIGGGLKIVQDLRDLKQKMFYALGVGKSGNDFGSWRSIADNMWDAFRRGFVEGIINAWSWVSPWLSWFAAMVRWIFKISSPSKVFADIGSSLMEGMAMGIEEMQKLPELAMKTAVTHIIQPAMSPLQTGAMRNQSVTNNFSMNINTQANAEPIISDFRMMQSLASGGF